MTIEFSFEIEREDASTGARAGVIRTPRGTARTPLFLPVGTRGTVKGMFPGELGRMGFEMLLANAYHLWLRPGTDVVEGAGGLHSFMNWPGLILTDSGGYQVFSLSRDVNLDSEGVHFRSPYDGSRVYMDPETCVAVQEALGADIMMVLDECVPYPCDKDYVERSVGITASWARRSQKAKSREDQALFGIVQGGMYADLRKRSAELTSELGFPGYGLGGFSVGEPRELMLEMVNGTLEALPSSAPRHLMGVGDQLGICEAVALGMDMFDSVLPTRVGRNGSAFVEGKRINLKNARFKDDHGPLEDDCDCPACSGYSRAYLHHLVLSREILAPCLLTCHNLYSLARLMERCRRAIMERRFESFLGEVRSKGSGE